MGVWNECARIVLNPKHRNVLKINELNGSFVEKNVPNYWAGLLSSFQWLGFETMGVFRFKPNHPERNYEPLL
jgi:hypothetical protein